MSRNKDHNVLSTPRTGAKYGRRVLRGSEPVALVGPAGNRDILSLQEFAEALYGEGTECVVIPPVKCNRN